MNHEETSNLDGSNLRRLDITVIVILAVLQGFLF